MNTIDNILNKYFEGVASSEEEKALKNYFRSGDILPKHEAYKPLFVAFDNEKQMAAPVFVIPKESGKRLSFPKLWIAAASAAAVILLAVILFPFNNKTQTQADYLVFINGKQITNPQKAQQYADKMFARAQDIIAQSLQPAKEAKEIQEKMDARNIFKETEQEIEKIHHK